VARHVKVVTAELVDGNVETDAATTLAKKIFDIINGKSAYTVSVARQGQHAAAVITYDD
jgi:hypothetical protein